MNNKDVIAITKQHQVTDISFPAAFHSAKGVRFQDIEGNQYLDFSSGYGVANVGWQHPEMVQELQVQAAKSTYAPPWMTSAESAELGRKLAGLLSNNDYKCFRATGGSDANEIALKVMFAKHGPGNVLSFYRSYHGGTHASLGMSDIDAFRLPDIKHEYKEFKAEPPYCFRCPCKKDPANCQLYCLNQVEEMLNSNNNIKCVFVEPILGSGGIIVPPRNYHKELYAICKSKGAVLIMDEVLTGNGRTGFMLASEYFDVKPDAITLAKGLASGFAAIGAALIDEEHISSYLKYDDVSSTFAWTPLSCALALKNMEILRNGNMLANAQMNGVYLKTHIEMILNKYLPEQLGEVRGLGLMIGCELVNNQKDKLPNNKLTMRVLLGMLRRGVMWCASWDYNTMIGMPPLCITRDECDEVLNAMELTVMPLAAKI